MRHVVKKESETHTGLKRPSCPKREQKSGGVRLLSYEQDTPFPSSTTGTSSGNERKRMREEERVEQKGWMNDGKGMESR